MCRGRRRPEPEGLAPKWTFLGTPLHWAARTGAKDVAELLLVKGAEVNARDDRGNTALHLAALYNRDEFAQLLVTKGADADVANTDGKTPLDLAVERGHNAIVDILKKEGAKE